MSLFELASATLRGGEQRVEVAAQNTVNAETPGYKSKVAFSELDVSRTGENGETSAPSIVVREQNSQGTLFDTGERLDLAINGPGYFLVRQDDQFSLVRGGKFGIDASGALVDAQGRTLQLANGGDAITSSYAIDILPDGTMLDGDSPMGTIGLFETPSMPIGAPLDADTVVQLQEAQSSEVRQAMLERSNVTLSDEMVEMMRAQRQIESGAQLIRAYDQLLAKAISTFDRSA